MTVRNVIMIVGDFPPLISGVGDYAACLSKALYNRGINVKVITSRVEGREEYVEEDGVKVFRMITNWDLRAIKDILRFIDTKNDQTITHIQYHCPQTYGRRPMINMLPAIIRLTKRKTPVIVTHHGLHEVSLQWKLRVIPMLIAPDGVLFVNSDDYWPTRKLLSLIGVKVGLIQMGSSIQNTTSSPDCLIRLRRAINIDDRDTIVAFFGNIRGDKGFEILLNIVKELWREKYSLRLLVIGGYEYARDASSAYSRKMYYEIKKGELEGWIIHVQAKAATDVSNYLKITDLAVFPFKRGARENNSSLLAAICHGIPVITTRGPSTPDKFEEVYGVETIPAGSNGMLYDRIKNFLIDETSRNEIQQRSRNRKPLISWNDVAEKTISFYNLFIGGSSTRN